MWSADESDEANEFGQPARRISGGIPCVFLVSFGAKQAADQSKSTGQRPAIRGGGGNRTDSGETVYAEVKRHSWHLRRENTVSVSRRQ